MTTTAGDDGGMTSEGEQEINADGWPILHGSPVCDGANPMTGRRCSLAPHKGYHRDSTDAEWLDQ